jgi:hypothetical protein
MWLLCRFQSNYRDKKSGNFATLAAMRPGLITGWLVRRTALSLGNGERPTSPDLSTASFPQ